MKKMLYAAVLALCLSSVAFAQTVLYQENFESGNTMNLNVSTNVDGNPTGTDCNSFFMNNVYQGGSFLLFGIIPVTIADVPNQPPAIANSPTSNYLHITSDLASSNGIENANFQAVDGMLCTNDNWHFATTPAIDATGYENITLNFWGLNNGSENSRAAVYYSFDGGNSWTPLGNNIYGTTDWTEFNLTDPVFDNQPSIQFGFLFVGSSDGEDSPLSVDEITVTGSLSAVCPTATNLSTRNVGTTAATLDWDFPNGTLTPDSVYVYFQAISATAWSRRKWTNVDSIRIYNLSENTTYRWRMRVFCGSTVMSDVYGSYFTTNFVCRPATNAQVTNITTNSATISWTSSPWADSAYVRYRKAGGLWLLTKTIGNAVNLTGLKTNSLYEYTIRQFCQNQVGVWTQIANFNTPSSKTELSEKNIQLYPNPVRDFLNVNFEAFGDYEIRVMDLTGREHLRWTGADAGDQSLALDISSLPAGIYFLQLNSGDTKFIQKITKY